MFKIEQVARIVHEANGALCDSIGDHSQTSWDEAPEWQRTSSMEAVRFHLENPDAPASASHERWMKERLETGWRYGETKDANARTNPCLVPFEQLPPDQQAKDHLIKAIVDALAPFIDK